jgi:hypothetical protein
MSEEGRILVEGGPVHRRVNHILYALAGFLVGGMLGFTLVFLELHNTARTNCQQVELAKTGLRETLEESERFVQSSPVRSAEEKAQSVEFYRDALGRLKPRHC